MTHVSRDQLPSTGMLIVLNGASSSGKSTLARALQSVLPGSFLHVQMDTFRAMEPPGYFGGARDPVGSLRVAALCRSLHAAAREYLAHGQNVILDHVLSPEAWGYFLEDFEARPVLLIGVFCSTEELCRRESTRSDRKPGLASSQVASIHLGRDYDYAVDTTAFEPEVCALELRRWLEFKPEPAAYARMRSHAAVVSQETPSK